MYSQVMNVGTDDDRCVTDDSDATENCRVQHATASQHVPLPFGQHIILSHLDVLARHGRFTFSASLLPAALSNSNESYLNTTGNLPCRSIVTVADGVGQGRGNFPSKNSVRCRRRKVLFKNTKFALETHHFWKFIGAKLKC